MAGPLTPPEPPVPDQDLVDQAAALLRGGEALLLLGSGALTAENLETAGRIAAATGCALMSEWSNARLERGAGRVAVDKVPYPIDAAIEVLARFRRIVLVGARAPIGFFAYPGKPAVLTRPDAEILPLADASDDVTAALGALRDAVGAHASAVVNGLRPEADVSGPLEPGESQPCWRRKFPRAAS
ncbi:hypothetical protein ACFOHS_18320 [Jhaorihella thermophila]